MKEWFMSLDSVAATKITTIKLKMEPGNLYKYGTYERFQGYGKKSGKK